MGRWLAPRLSDAQRWVLYDWDADLLAHAAADMPGTAADGSPVAVETRGRDISRLRLDDLAGASLVTASALLDMLTREEIERLVRSCVDAGCPGLFTLTVTGRVELAPADPLDGHIVAAFNDHQRRTTGGRRLLGPDAVHAWSRRSKESATTLSSGPAPGGSQPTRPTMLRSSQSGCQAGWGPHVSSARGW